MLVKALWKTAQRFPKELKLKTLFGSAIVLLDNYPKKLKTSYYSNTCRRKFMQPQFIRATSRKHPVRSSADKENVLTILKVILYCYKEG